MSESLLLLTLAYVALAALLLVVLLRSPLHWSLKLLLCVAAPTLYFVSYQGWRLAQGWPAQGNTLPSRFLLHASVIQEPDPATGDAGHIDLWLSMLDDQDTDDSPRAYRVAYAKELHSALDDALREMRNGKLQLGRVARVEGDPAHPLDLSGLGERREKIDFYALPDPALPEK